MLSQTDRRWLLREIIRLVPEFGVCRQLGTALMNYFVFFGRPEEWDVMLCNLLDENIGTRLQEIFEWSIHHAIHEYFEEEVSSFDATLGGLLVQRREEDRENFFGRIYD